jgi:hypothetical protein
MAKQTYGVYVSGFPGPVEQLEVRLVQQGMSEARAREVVASMPCFVKRNVPIDVAVRYKRAFEAAGAWVTIENWQTTANPAACTGYVARPGDEPVLEFEAASGTDQGATIAEEATADEAPAPAASPRPSYSPRPEHPLTKHLPAGIVVAIALVIGSYFYGCAHVMGVESDFKELMGDVGVALENRNARGLTVTREAIAGEVRALGRRAGIAIDDSGVRVSPERIRVRRNGFGGCAIVHLPDTARLLPVWERDALLRDAASCDVPGWIVGIRVATRVRWGLYSRRVEFERFALVREYADADADADADAP